MKRIMMFVSLKDFDIDIFLRLEDTDIFIYYIDFETIPELVSYMPLGSFDDEGKMQLTALPMEDRINVGLAFLHRDLYAEYEDITRNTMIRVDRFMEQFGNIPEVVDFFEPYLSLCDGPNPPEWCSKCNDEKSQCPDYCSNDYDTCAISIPIEEFYKVKGEPTKRFEIDVLTADMVNDSNKVLEAEVFTHDSDGTLFSNSDQKSYVVEPILSSTQRLSRLGEHSYVTIESIGETLETTPIFRGTSLEVQTPIKLEVNDIMYSIQPEPNGDWEFQLPVGDALPRGNYKATVASESNINQVIIGEEIQFKVLQPDININQMGNINNNKPTFSGTSSDVYIITAYIQNDSYRVQPDPNGNWYLTIDNDLLDGPHELIVVGEYQVNNNSCAACQVEDRINLEVDTTSILILDEISDGYLHLDEHDLPLAITGSSQGIEEGQQVVITLNGRKYYTEILNSRFEYSILNEDVRFLAHNVGYQVEVKAEDRAGNKARDVKLLIVDLEVPTLSIYLEEISPVDQNSTYTLVSGEVRGDVQKGDKVVIYINGRSISGYVYDDTKYDTSNPNQEIDYSDVYYMIVLFFNGIYRTNPQNAQEFGTYNMLTDINFEINNYSLIINIKEFFTREFIYYLKCIPGSLPFANEYGTNIKLAVQTKNFIVQQLEIEAEINYFINNFNEVYGNLVQVKHISLVSQEGSSGADSWLIEVFADIQQDRLIYRLEV